MRTHALWMVLLMMAGCAPMGDNLVALREKKPSAAGNFNQALAAEYLAYAESVGEEGHPLRANHFAGKGLAALRGENVPLEDKPALAQRKPAVTALLTPDVKEVAPAKAARLQLMYDCWAEKEGVCEQSFMEAFTDLQFVADALVRGGTNRFIAHFEPGSAALTDGTSAVLDVVASRVVTVGAYTIEIDAAGGKNLASKRLLAVEKGLIKRGVDAGRINRHVSASGKEVMLSVDKNDIEDNSVLISIQSAAGKP